MTKITQSVLLFTLLAASGAAWGETYYYQQVSDSPSNTSFTNISWAVDSSVTKRTIAEIIATDPDAVFVTARGTGTSYLLRTPTDGNQTFPGKCLQLGDSSKGGALLLKMGGGKSLTVTNLTLVAGAMANGDNGTQTLLSKNAIKVQTTAARSFAFTGGNDRAITIDANLESEDTAVLKVNRYSLNDNAKDERDKSFTLTLTGDNSAYRGKWIVDNLTSKGDNASLPADTKCIILSVADASKLGANPETLVADTITLTNNAVLNVTGDTLDLDNRGLTIASTGGRIKHTGDLTISGTISGDGTLDLTGVTGKITLMGTIAEGITVKLPSGGALDLAGCTNNGTLTLTGDVTLNGNDTTIGGTLNGTGTLKDSLNTGKEITLQGTVEGAVSVDLVNNGTTKLLSWGAGFVWSSSGALVFPSISVTSPGTSIVGYRSDGSSKVGYTTAVFTDGTGIGMGTNYFVYGSTTIRTPQQSEDDTFPATSGIILVGKDANTVQMVQKDKTFTIAGGLTLGPNAIYEFGGYGDNATSGQELAGVVKIASSGGYPATISGGNNINRHSTISAAISGSTPLVLTNANLTVSGSMAEYTGALTIATNVTFMCESGTQTNAATSIAFSGDAKIAKAGNGTVLFKGVEKSALEGHLADGTYAKQVVRGVELTNTAPAATGITIIIAEGGSETTIDLDSSDALYNWIPEANRTDATTISDYLRDDGEGGINGLEAFLLGYESVPTTAPQLAATATSEGWTFTFDGNEPRTLDGVKVTYKMQGRATASAEWAEISDATAENGAITLPLADAMLFNRLVAVIAAE